MSCGNARDAARRQGDASTMDGLPSSTPGSPAALGGQRISSARGTRGMGRAPEMLPPLQKTAWQLLGKLNITLPPSYPEKQSPGFHSHPMQASGSYILGSDIPMSQEEDAPHASVS